MNRFEYEITSHPSDVLQSLEYCCTPEGECSKEQRPEKKMSAGCCEFLNILNERGRHGWEFIQLFFFDKSINACWKRETQTKNCAQT